MLTFVEYLPHYNLEAWGELQYAKENDSGFDFRAAIPERLVISQGEILIIPTGVKLELDIVKPYIEPAQVFDLQVRSRSGLAAKHGLFVVNSPGTIDNGYRGEIKIILGKLTRGSATIEPGDRIAQGVFSRVLQGGFKRVDKVDENTDRGAGGFGSTGKS